ncbi:dynein regulatory complex subunit 7-like [Adelges cooleyi]|uniref:dynein regulatory complex subunit 7-like n=1 Tax=Adelges cooleyi TaxID=133065 RepID=UPI00217FA7BD|nr:dynein regulatory complex subunit 7-like [Adelges cooleyi]
MDVESLDWILEDVESQYPSAFNDEQLEDNDIDYDYKNDEDAQSDSCASYEVITVFDENLQAQVGELVANEEYHEEENATSRLLLLSDLNEDIGDRSAEKRYVDALEEAKFKIAEVELVWPEVLQKCLLNQENIPDLYVKNTNMEKLVLLYADNFIKQFDAKHSHRRQLLLVHENECGYQKCICTTIKPSRLVYSDLDDLDSYSMFVAQHITYKPLDNPVVVPKQMISPAMVLEIQTGNCFEMATLLASFLIGRGYNAFVVQGYAEQEDLHEANIAQLEDVDEEYSVDPPIDLCSEYVTTLIEEERKAYNVVQETKEENEMHVYDPLHGRRVHCWVMILPLKIKDHYVSRDTFFIEPSTGERLDEPTHLRRLPLKQDNTNDVYTHLFMPSSWVNILQVPRHRYLMKYPAGKKVVMYSNAIKECYADYVMPDGLVKRTTYYEKQDRANKTFVKEVYKHRIDRLVRIDITYTTEETENVEYFSSGREDCLKTHRFYSNTINVEDKRVISFYDTTRLDSLIEIHMDPLLVIARFKGRSVLSKSVPVIVGTD